MLPGTTKKRDIIAKFRRLGWDGPRSGGNHQFMVKGAHKQRIPNTDCGRDLLKEILRQAGISEDEWMGA